MEEIAIEITESFIEISLPYLVYTIKIAKVIIPITKKIQAKIHRLNEGTSKLVICINVNDIRFITFLAV